jgi:hypothetical protein
MGVAKRKKEENTMLGPVAHKGVVGQEGGEALACSHELRSSANNA